VSLFPPTSTLPLLKKKWIIPPPREGRPSGDRGPHSTSFFLAGERGERADTVFRRKSFPRKRKGVGGGRTYLLLFFILGEWGRTFLFHSVRGSERGEEKLVFVS